MSEQDKEIFIESVKNRIFFYIEAGFWSKPGMERLRMWLSNFETIEEQYIAYKLLDNFVFYSESDIIALLKYGIEEKIFKRNILREDKETDYTTSESSLNSLRLEFISKTAILPLKSDNMSSSAHLISRHITNELGFPEDQVLDADELSLKLLKKYDRILIVDDFIGTGDQIVDFWNYDTFHFEGKDRSMSMIKDMCKGINFEYLCVVATSQGIQRFYAGEAGFRNDLLITFCEELSEKFMVFSSNSVYFDNDEIDEAKGIIQDLCQRKGVSFLGHKAYSYAIAFHHTIPDCSMPLFFKNNKDWKYLFRNKLTDNGIL